MKKRIIAILLAALMIVALLPTVAFAGEVTDCTYTQKVTTPENGKTYGMKLNCKDKGEFTFEASGTDWNIKNSGDKYLNAENGKLVLGDTATTAWTYKNGAFSTSVKTTQKTSGHWLGLIYIPGSSKTVTTTYYLSTVTDGAKLSTKIVSTELYEEVSSVHEWGAWTDCKDGENHKRVCKNCGKVETEAHEFDPVSHKCVCGAYDPSLADVKIGVAMKEKTEKQYVGFWPFGYYKNVKTYTATIKTEATGTKVKTVEYSVNGGRTWNKGSSYSSNSPIRSLKVRVTDNFGNKYDYVWPEVEVSEPPYTVTFNLNGVTAEPINPITVTEDGLGIVAPEEPSAEGYAFKGWYATKDAETGALSDEWDFDNDTVTADVTLYAKWVETKTLAELIGDSILFMDSYSGNSDLPGSWSSPDSLFGFIRANNGGECLTLLRKGNTYTGSNSWFLICTAEKTGDNSYVYDAFGDVLTFTMSEGTLVSITVEMTGDHSNRNGTYTAPFTVTFDLNGIEATAIKTQYFTAGDSKATKPEDPSAEGYAFKGWYATKDAGTGALSDEWDFDNSTVTADVTLYAKWVETKTFAELIGDSIPEINYNEQQSLPGSWISPDSGYGFIRKPSGAGLALYQKGNVYTGGSTWPLTCTAEKAGDNSYVYSGITGVLTFTMSEGTLMSITVEMTGADSNRNGTYTAPFTVTFDLNGVEATAIKTQYVPTGGKATKPTDPSAEGYAFKGWYATKDAGTGALSDEWDFDNSTVTADVTLYAKWVETKTFAELIGDSIPVIAYSEQQSLPGSWSSYPDSGYGFIIKPSGDVLALYQKGNVYTGGNMWPLTCTAEKAGDNSYVYSGITGVLTFTMSGETLMSITVEMTGADSNRNGTYTAPDVE